MLASGSFLAAFTVCVAPNSFAILSLLSSRSTAMIFSAPASTAPWMTLIAGRHRRDAGPHLGDDARALVPDDARWGHGQDAPLDAEVAVTDAAGRELDAHLSLARRGELDVLDRERLVEAVQDGGAHGGPP